MMRYAGLIQFFPSERLWNLIGIQKITNSNNQIKNNMQEK